jgi:hypothetical protein
MKALIKETGEILDIKSNYGVSYFTMSIWRAIKNELSDELLEQIEGQYIHESSPKEEGQYYTLSNGKEYHEKDLIVGIDNIREDKLNKII